MIRRRRWFSAIIDGRRAITCKVRFHSSVEQFCAVSLVLWAHVFVLSARRNSRGLPFLRSRKIYTRFNFRLDGTGCLCQISQESNRWLGHNSSGVIGLAKSRKSREWTLFVSLPRSKLIPFGYFFEEMVSGYATFRIPNKNGWLLWKVQTERNSGKE